MIFRLLYLLKNKKTSAKQHRTKTFVHVLYQTVDAEVGDTNRCARRPNILSTLESTVERRHGAIREGPVTHFSQLCSI